MLLLFLLMMFRFIIVTKDFMNSIVRSTTVSEERAGEVIIQVFLMITSECRTTKFYDKISRNQLTIFHPQKSMSSSYTPCSIVVLPWGACTTQAITSSSSCFGVNMKLREGRVFCLTQPHGSHANGTWFYTCFIRRLLIHTIPPARLHRKLINLI